MPLYRLVLPEAFVSPPFWGEDLEAASNAPGKKDFLLVFCSFQLLPAERQRGTARCVLLRRSFKGFKDL